jgi:hypothetical protein
LLISSTATSALSPEFTTMCEPLGPHAHQKPLAQGLRAYFLTPLMHYSMTYSL